MAEGRGIIKEVKRELESIFRHMLPGIAVLIAASLAHPHWLDPYDFGNVWHLAVLGAIAVVAGNIWYVFHRFSLHQLIDYLTYAAVNRRLRGYFVWLATHIRESFSVPKDSQPLKDHIHLRSAQIIFLFVCSEIAIAFTFHAERGTIFRDHAGWIWIIAVVGIASAIFQQVVGFIIDLHAVQSWKTASAETKVSSVAASGN